MLSTGTDWARKATELPAKAWERVDAWYRRKIRERAIERAKVRIALHGRKVDDFSEDELEAVVAEEEEAQIRESLLKPMAFILFLLGLVIGW